MARDSRPPSPVRHICHPRSGRARPGRGSSSYRYWLERMRKETPAYLTITSLELPDSPIPLIESQVSAKLGTSEVHRPQVSPGRDEREVLSSRDVSSVSKSIERARKQFLATRTTDSDISSLQKSRRNFSRDDPIISNTAGVCVCSEIPSNLQISIQEETIVVRSRSPSPEVTHTIRIAMKYLGQASERHSDNSDEKIISSDSSLSPRIKIPDSCCSGINVALDFTLNCNSVQLTSRDISLKPVTRSSN